MPPGRTRGAMLFLEPERMDVFNQKNTETYRNSPKLFATSNIYIYIFMNAFKEDNPKRHPSGSMESPSHPRDGQTRADWAKAVAPRDPVCFPPSKSIGVSMPSADHTRSTGEPGGKTGETGGFDRPSHGGRGSRWRMWHGMREVFPGVPSPSQQEFFFLVFHASFRKVAT